MKNRKIKKMSIYLIIIGLLFISINLFSECRLMIISSRYNTTLNTDNPNTTYANRAINGLQQQGADNPDGWGLVSYSLDSSDTTGTYRGSEPANNSNNYNNAEQEIFNTRNLHLVIGHVRNACSGAEDIDDPHPFVMRLFGNDYSFAHNGIADKSNLLNLIENNDDFLPEPWLETHPPHTYGHGDWEHEGWDYVVDSEMYFLWIMLNVRKYNGNIYEALHNALSSMSNNGHSWNFVFTDGVDIYAYRNTHYDNQYFDHDLKYTLDTNVNPTFWGVMSTPTISIPTEMIPEDALLYLPTVGNPVLFYNFSTSIVSMVKVLKKGYNWDGFPILQSDSENGPSVLQFLTGYGISSVENPNWYHYTYYYNQNNDSWSPNGDFTFNRTTFYKIVIDNDTPDISEDNSYQISGIMRNPDIPNITDVQKDVIYWLNYNLLPSQNIKDAFGEYWDRVKKVKAQNWYYDWGHIESKGDSVSSAPAWETKNKTMEFGKGYEITFSEDIPSFKWHYPRLGLQNAKKDKEPEIFTYQEKSDYEAIDILSIDDVSKETIKEIGVFQDGVCIGATVVDSFPVQILAYSNPEGGDLSFQVATGSKSNKKIANYSVYNVKTGYFENLPLKPRRQEYSIIKLGKGDYTPVPPKYTLSIQNYPNPFNPETKITFSLPKDEKIRVEIYNIKGQKVRTLTNGIYQKGNYNLIWKGLNDSGKKVGSGLYLYRLITKEKTITKKMLLLK